MSLTYVASITPATATLRDGCTDELNNQVIIVESNSNTIRGYDLSTQAQNFSWSVSTAPSCVSMLSTGIAAVGYSGTSVIDFVQLSTGFRQSGAAGTTSSTVKGQLMAADFSLGVGFMTSSTARQYFRFTYSSGPGGIVTSYVNSAINTSSQTNCVILKSTGRFLFGTTAGQVFEVNAGGEIVDIADFGNVPNAGNLSTSTNTANSINYLSYDNNLLLIGWAQGALTLVDWSTKEVLYTQATGSQVPGTMLSAAASGVCISSRNYTTNTTSNVLFETDFTCGAPISSSLPLFTDQTSAMLAAGINATTGRGWALQTTPRIRIFDVTPRASTTRTITYQPLGSDVQFRLLVLDRTGGVGTATRLLDTYAQSPGTYRFPTGKTLIVAVGYGEGANALYKGSQIST